MDSLLRIEHVTVSYEGEEVIQDISFDLKPGEILGIVGESGSGKSTIIKAITGLLGQEGIVTKGNIWYKDHNLAEMNEKQLCRYRVKEIGMVFQDCKSALCPVRKVGAQVYEAVIEHEKVSTKEIMEKIGLHDSERVLESYPFQLSGGMNQRVGICIAMIMQPKVLLADEPTSALDVTVQKQVVEELLLLRKEYHTSMIIVTHNIGVVRKMADKVLVLKDGQVRDYGETKKVLEHSKDSYTRELMGSVLHLNHRKIPEAE